MVWVFFVVFLASSFFFLHRRFWALAHFKPTFKHFKPVYIFFHTLFHSHVYQKHPNNITHTLLASTPFIFLGTNEAFWDLGYCVYWFTEIQFVKLLNNFKSRLTNEIVSKIWLLKKNPGIVNRLKWNGLVLHFAP